MSYKDIPSMPQEGQFIQIWRTGRVNPQIFAERLKWIDGELFTYEPNGRAEDLGHSLDYRYWDEEWYQYEEDMVGILKHREANYNAVYVVIDKDV